jgi:hypothetical protein
VFTGHIMCKIRSLFKQYESMKRHMSITGIEEKQVHNPFDWIS